MDLWVTNTTTELWGLIGVVQFYRGILLRCCHVVASLAESIGGPKGRKGLCNNSFGIFV